MLYATSAVILGIAVLGAAGAAGMLDNELRAAGIVLPPEPTVTAAYIAPVVAAPEVTVPAETTVTSVASVTTPPAPELAPVIGEGQSDFRDGIVAVRGGAEVKVFFDTPLTRTRRPEKFEAVVRATLPQIYGAAADSALAGIPVGALVPREGLVTDLPVQGLAIPVRDGVTLRVWPETRPGQEGPLVVRYRATVAAPDA
ncbi:MAG: hypothetical protein M3125_05765 [Gemmatimonadota bacterium]|nr:hypothetical protein [Gemmatimonadota bacterium]